MKKLNDGGTVIIMGRRFFVVTIGVIISILGFAGCKNVD